MTASRQVRRLEVVDDPLLVGRAARPAPTVEARSDDVAPAAEASAPTSPLPQPARSPRGRGAPAESARRTLRDQRPWEPPALDEQLTLLAARVPASLERALERHAVQLREEEGGSSQKRLPKQEVLAALLWTAGDPNDSAARHRLRCVYRKYRSRRLAAAARSLEQG